ncbi:hypothetical protein LVJ94_13470 [Pendulispora rubella]|uniref:Lipoprotein n=1 Tax=Pendulispora rubella TaxID=2741070 RepID=A0ABZ2LBU5_9BACT
MLFSWPRRHLGAFAVVAACAACSASSSPDDGGGNTTQDYAIRTQAIDKVDLLLAVDNSFSMGDKEAILADAIPDLLARLLTPRCVNDEGAPTGASADAMGKCVGGKPEFAPIHDLHVGIVSSSLGTFADICPRTEPENDDRGHLLARVARGQPAALSKPSNFLTWLPETQENQGKRPVDGATTEPSVEKLTQDLSNLVRGVGNHGCGFEAQLESMYRFLVQPDPYATAEREGDSTVLRGIDSDILRQRRDFLRPDSIVAVIMLTDENEASLDPRALAGRAWQYQSSAHVKGGTSPCATHPNDPACTTCFLATASSRPECAAALGDEADPPALRFFDMKRRFGVDARYPIERYVRGLSQVRIPNRDGEHPGDALAYLGDANCSNPLFARDLPSSASDTSQLCNLPRGPRTPDMVFFTLIGGVPWQLLTTEPGRFTNNTGSLKNTLDEADWKRILGADPFHYDFNGLDPHMRESITKREGLPAPDDALPREWDTRGQDLQYACTYPLATPKDCSASPDGCECTQQSDSSICDPTRPSMQVRGKAYPSVNALAVAKALGPQGVVASACPRTMDVNRPEYGYRPAIEALVSHMKSAFGPEQCLPTALAPRENGTVDCRLLELLPAGEQATACDPAKGLEQPEASALTRFRENQKAANADAASLALPVCALKQLLSADLVQGSCESSPAPGWCYVTRASQPAAKCERSIRFSTGGKPAPGTVVELQCTPQAI